MPPSGKITLVIFDLDGTLVDAYKAVSASLNHALGRFGFGRLDDETIKRSVGWGDKNLVARFVPPEKLDEVLSVYRIHHRSALKSGTKFLPEAKDLLERLKQDGYKLAIASNRPSRFTHIILKHLQVGGHFDAVVCADEVEYPKPAPDILHRILRQCRTDKEAALFVGDMTIDVETGARAQVPTVAVATGSSTVEELRASGARRIVARLSELLPLIHE